MIGEGLDNGSADVKKISGVRVGDGSVGMVFMALAFIAFDLETELQMEKSWSRCPGQKCLRHRCGWGIEDGIGRTGLHDGAALKHHDPIGDMASNSEIVRN